jgi:hypothetical protein
MYEELVPAANVDFLFRCETIFHKRNLIQRHTLHVRVANTLQRRNIVRSENLRSAWGRLEHLWVKL